MRDAARALVSGAAWALGALGIPLAMAAAAMLFCCVPTRQAPPGDERIPAADGAPGPTPADPGRVGRIEWRVPSAATIEIDFKPYRIARDVAPPEVLHLAAGQQHLVKILSGDPIELHITRGEPGHP